MCGKCFTEVVRFKTSGFTVDVAPVVLCTDVFIAMLQYALLIVDVDLETPNKLGKNRVIAKVL